MGPEWDVTAGDGTATVDRVLGIREGAREMTTFASAIRGTRGIGGSVATKAAAHGVSPSPERNTVSIESGASLLGKR